MTYDTLLVERRDGVATVTINRPEVRNALSAEVVRELRQILGEIAMDEAVRVVVLTGAGEKSFAAGADISQLWDRTFADALRGEMQRLYDDIEDYEKPTVAAVNGYALGGGCELAMACDVRVAAENAKFGLPELNLGIIPGAGGTQRLARLVGKGRALEMILTGRMVDAREAERIGLVSHVTDASGLLEKAHGVASSMMGKGPVALRLARMAVKAGLETDQRTGLLIERLAQAVLFSTDDKVEGTSAFLEKRTPNFQGR
ncbi:enoyl-CoA hydratase/isomerase family protein [Alicyclobacillus dauci]|uniref:Enoyl-CoA hydratase-related protein n=1 Tax=Alicyclobacillus dauci TaxID=1475485 RepID=A0ABY6Z5I3_9BACL|nr:enoyl-CoA hydratase-related protein [Alicyclobacillus dauci]WAH38019.1 enoyl-CoA hydratase-related protein [Alicyclobacillus dauci]